MIITDNLSDDQLLNKIYEAADEYEKLLGKDYLLVGQNRQEAFYWFQCCYEKKQFMHLLGIKSKNLSADDFFDACANFNKGIGLGIKISDCTPSGNHNRKTINKKCSCCADLLKIKNAKYMKIGNKNLINQFVDFQYAYGNEATLGFYEKETVFPITLLPNSMDNYTTNKHKIIFVFEKLNHSSHYTLPIIEIKTGLFRLLYPEFPENLKNLIKTP